MHVPKYAGTHLHVDNSRRQAAVRAGIADTELSGTPHVLLYVCIIAVHDNHAPHLKGVSTSLMYTRFSTRTPKPPSS